MWLRERRTPTLLELTVRKDEVKRNKWDLSRAKKDGVFREE